MKSTLSLSLIYMALVLQISFFSHESMAAKEEKKEQEQSLFAWAKEKYRHIVKKARKVKNNLKKAYESFFSKGDKSKKSSVIRPLVTDKYSTHKKENRKRLDKIHDVLKKQPLFSISKHHLANQEQEIRLSESDWEMSGALSQSLLSDSEKTYESPENIKILPEFLAIEDRKMISVGKQTEKDVLGKPITLKQAREIQWITSLENVEAFKKYTILGKEELSLVLVKILIAKKKCSYALGRLQNLKNSKWKDESNGLLRDCFRKLGMHSLWANEISQEERGMLLSEVKRSGVLNDLPREYQKQLAEIMIEKNIKPSELASKSKTITWSIEELIRRGRIKEAKKWIARLESYKKDYYLGLIYFSEGKYESAKRSFERVLKNKEKLSPRIVQASHLSVARVLFHKKKYTKATDQYKKVTKNSVFWIDAIIEMGWSQLLAGSYEEAIGNMYSLHTPYFESVFQPESYVVRSIGYLNLCQYPDAYKSLTFLEKRYSKWHKQVRDYMSSSPNRTMAYVMFKGFMRGKVSKSQMPPQILREIARKPKITSSQKYINKIFSEEKNWKRQLFRVSSEIQRIKLSQKTISRQIVKLTEQNDKKKLRFFKKNHDLQKKYLSELFLLQKQIEKTQLGLKKVWEGQKKLFKKKIGAFFIAEMKVIENTLSKVLENNEFLRFEVFSGSGENLRASDMRAGKKKRIVASVKPESKKLLWSFEGEIWLDEIGHFRSSLVNNCSREVSTRISGR